MTLATMLQAGLPYIVLTSGLLLVMIGVSIKRTHAVAAVLTIITLLVTILSHILAYSALSDGAVQVTPLFKIDGIAYLFNILFLLAALVVAFLGSEFISRRVRFKEEFYLLLLCATLGSLVLPASVHFASLILGLEIVGISLYAMIAYPEKARAPLEAGLKYLVLSGVGSAALLFGMALIYSGSGSMEFSNTHPTDGSLEGQYLYLIGNAFFWSGIAFKLSLVPFHIWTPDVYHGAPSFVTGFLATVSKGAVFAVVFRYVVEGNVLDSSNVQFALMLIACASMVIGNLLALLQTNLKRLLAYSSIAHMGYLLIAVLLVESNSALGYETVILYLVGYFVMTLAAFGVVSVLSTQTENELDTIEGISGLLWRQPFTGAVLIISAISLAGIPLTIGFVAKFYVFAAGIDGSMWTLIVALVIGSAIGIYYYLRIVFAAIKKPTSDAETPTDLPWTGVGILTFLGLCMLVFGIYPTNLINLIQSVVQASGF